MLILGLIGMLALSPEAPQTSPVTCAIIQAAFGALNERAEAVYPEHIVRVERLVLGGFKDFPPEYRARLRLQPSEVEDLAANQKPAAPDFVPDCAWKGEVLSRDDPRVREPAVFGFGVPILSSDGKLALIDMSYRMGISGHGYVCTMRLASGAWSGHCTINWSER